METQYIDLAPEVVVQLSSKDRALPELSRRAVHREGISYSWMRTRFKEQNGTQAQLDRGRAIINDSSQLDQYLYSYAPMIASQWAEVCRLVKLDGGEFNLIDYGCGQGLAGLLMADHLGQNLFKQVPEICLVEPSAVALIRAAGVYRCIAPDSAIRCVCKAFDDLCEDDLRHRSPLPTVHIMSNVLDVEGFDHFQLFSKLLCKGNHTIIAVSHDRDHDGGSARFHSVKEALEAFEKTGEVRISFSDTHQFKCKNPSQSDAILWFLDVDVLT